MGIWDELSGGGGTAGGVTQILSGGGNYAYGQLTGTNQANANAQANLEYQKQVFDWQKNLQERIFQREDNAIQRQTADLKAAGFNPILAAGGKGAGAGQAIKINAPQKKFHRNDMVQALQNYVGLMTQKANIAQTQAGADLAMSQAGATQVRKNIDQHNLNIAKKTGMPTNPSVPGGIARDVAIQADKVVNHIKENAGSALKNKAFQKEVLKESLIQGMPYLPLRMIFNTLQK